MYKKNKHKKEDRDLFKLKQTCKDCPFVEGSSTNKTILNKRIIQIKSDLLQDQSFSCHKTVNYNEDKPTTVKEQHCVGAMMWLYKVNHPNQMMRIGERFGLLKEENLSSEGRIID
ncbi:hypothetical protein EBB07_28520 [Paenibacillaceae bacterium]|nr:hypothetical protein EBB07_28520 [Paenibacillaceae bacterium]